MRRRRQSRDGEGALELIEQAVHLLRLSGARALGLYYLGAAPFVLGLLYFWVDMSRSSAAEDHCAPAALGTALLFFWMKTWQAIFVGQLKPQITGRPAPPLTGSRLFRVALVQTVLQPSGLFILPTALLITLPFGWVYAFYQSVTAAATYDGADVRLAFQKAARHAQLWPKQNHLLLAIFLLLGVVVFVDVGLGLFQIPWLLKTLFGVESAFTRGGWTFFNTTFLAAVCGLTYLCLDPLMKTVYLLRTFYGESLRTGEDLKAELKSIPTLSRAAMTVLVLALFVFNGLAATRSVKTGETPSQLPWPELQDPRVEVSPPELDRSIAQVIEQREFNWRLPRERRVEDQTRKGVLASFVDGVLETIRGWGKNLARWGKAALNRVVDFMVWLKEKVFGKSKPPSGARDSRMSWMIALQILIFVLLALAAAVVALLFYRTWRRRRGTAMISAVVAPVPDLADENVVASQLPADDWLKLAGELMGRGELLLALRALYLASLAHLAQREMISVAKFKSNRDYEQELRRRARSLPELQAAFTENVAVFDRAWYGLHEVTEEALQRFRINLEKIMV
jgi:hypothetical protein